MKTLIKVSTLFLCLTLIAILAAQTHVPLELLRAREPGQVLVVYGTWYNIRVATVKDGTIIENADGTLTLEIQAPAAAVVEAGEQIYTLTAATIDIVVPEIFIPNTLRVIRGGIELSIDEDYEMAAGNTVHFLANAIPQSGDVIKIAYLKLPL